MGGQTHSGQTHAGQTHSGQTHAGQTHPGQTHPGQIHTNHLNHLQIQQQQQPRPSTSPNYRPAENHNQQNPYAAPQHQTPQAAQHRAAAAQQMYQVQPIHANSPKPTVTSSPGITPQTHGQYYNQAAYQHPAHAHYQQQVRHPYNPGYYQQPRPPVPGQQYPYQPPPAN